MYIYTLWMDYGHELSMTNTYYMPILIKMKHKLVMVRSAAGSNVCSILVHTGHAIFTIMLFTLMDDNTTGNF